MLLEVDTKTWARDEAESVQSTVPQPRGDPGSIPSVELSMIEMASPSLLLLTPPLSTHF